MSTKVRIVKAMVFPTVVYRCQSWTLKKAEHQTIDAFELWCWRRLLRVPWTTRRSNQTTLQEVNPEYAVEGLTPLLWPPDLKRWLTGKDPDAGKEWGQEEKGAAEDQMVGWHHRLNAHEFEQTPGHSEGQARLVCYSPWGHKESDTTEELNIRSSKKIRRYCTSQLSIHPFNESTYNVSGTKILCIWNWS